MMVVSRAGGYYVDVGASELIISNQVKLRSPAVIERLTPDGVVLDSGEVLPADLIVHATGFEPPGTLLRDLFASEVADAVGPVWGIGSGRPGDPGPWEGELRNMWKPTAQEGLWFHAGDLALCRSYSLPLALALKARFEGLPTPVYRGG